MIQILISQSLELPVSGKDHIRGIDKGISFKQNYELCLESLGEILQLECPKEERKQGVEIKMKEESI